MGQSALDDDELFGEAADEMRSEVEEHLDAARAELPEAEAIWETDADNVLGVLNGLRSALDTGEAAERLRQAKKQFVVGERADAFEDADDLAADIEDVEDLLASLEVAHEQVGDLTSTIPELRSTLEEAADEADDEASDEADAEAEAEA